MQTMSVTVEGLRAILEGLTDELRSAAAYRGARASPGAADGSGARVRVRWPRARDCAARGRGSELNCPAHPSPAAAIEACRAREGARHPDPARCPRQRERLPWPKRAKSAASAGRAFRMWPGRRVSQEPWASQRVARLAVSLRPALSGWLERVFASSCLFSLCFVPYQYQNTAENLSRQQPGTIRSPFRPRNRCLAVLEGGTERCSQPGAPVGPKTRAYGVGTAVAVPVAAAGPGVPSGNVPIASSVAVGSAKVGVVGGVGVAGSGGVCAQSKTDCSA